MIIRRATPTDIPAIINMRRERMDWLAGIGSDQWSVGLGEDGFAHRVAASINAGETWIATDTTTESPTVIGTIAIDHWTNPGLWSEDELADAVIVHRMITPLSAAGQGIGTALLAHADRLAVEDGCPWIRLDAWTTNHALHRLYERCGFRYVRTVEEHPSRSAALFEKRAAVVVPSDTHKTVLGLEGPRDRAENPIPPDHHHIVRDMRVQRPALFGDSARLDISPGGEWRLWWENDAWRLVPRGHAGRDCPYPRNLNNAAIKVVNLPKSVSLKNYTAEYRLQHSTRCEVVLTPTESKVATT